MPFPPMGPGPGAGPGPGPSSSPSSPTPPPPDSQLAPVVAALTKISGDLQVVVAVLTQMATGPKGQPDAMPPPSQPHPSGPPIGASPSIQGLGR